jgi:hypothetical protein
MRGYPRTMGARRRTDLLAAAAIVATGLVAWATQAPGGSWTVGERSVLWPVALVGWLAVFYLGATGRVWGPWPLTRLRRFRARLRHLRAGEPRRPRWERVGPSMIDSVERAQAEAISLDHNYVGTEHLLLGLLGEPRSPAGRLLAARGVDHASMRARLEVMVGRGPAKVTGAIGLTPRSKRAIAIAMERGPKEGDLLTEDNYLLQGLLEVGDGLAVGLLIESGVDVAELARAAKAPRS